MNQNNKKNKKQEDEHRIYLVQDQFDPYIQGRDFIPSYSSLVIGQETYTLNT